MSSSSSSSFDAAVVDLLDDDQSEPEQLEQSGLSVQQCFANGNVQNKRRRRSWKGLDMSLSSDSESEDGMSFGVCSSLQTQSVACKFSMQAMPSSSSSSSPQPSSPLSTRATDVKSLESFRSCEGSPARVTTQTLQTVTISSPCNSLVVTPERPKILQDDGKNEVISLLSTGYNKMPPAYARKALSPVSLMSVSPLGSPTRKRSRSLTGSDKTNDQGHLTTLGAIERQSVAAADLELDSPIKRSKSSGMTDLLLSDDSSPESSPRKDSSSIFPVRYSSNAQMYRSVSSTAQSARPTSSSASSQDHIPPSSLIQVSTEMSMPIDLLNKATVTTKITKRTGKPKAHALNESASLAVNNDETSEKPLTKRELKRIEKETKARQTKEAKLGEKVRKGAFAKRELLVSFSHEMSKSALGHALQGACLAEEFNFKVDPALSDAPGMIIFSQYSLEPSDETKGGFKLKDDKLEPIIDSKKEPSPVGKGVLLFWDSNDFITRLCTDQHGYQALEEVVQSARHCWSRLVETRPRNPLTDGAPKIIVIFCGMNDAILEKQKAKKRENGSEFVNYKRASQNGLSDALAWLLIAYDIDSRLLPQGTDKASDCFKEFVGATLETLHYQEPLPVEILSEFKKQNTGQATEWGMDSERDDFILHSWYLMLRCLIGDIEARRLIKHYPCARLLLDAYDDPNLSVKEKEELVADILRPNTRQLKTSRNLYRMLTSEDPNLLLK